MADTSARRQRMSNQDITPYTSQPRVTYQIQVFDVFDFDSGAWRTLRGHRYKTASEARAIALDGNKTPVTVNQRWRIIRSISVYEAVVGDD